MELTALDYTMLLGYFVVMIVIGLWSMLFVKKQEDYFLGSRSFGKIFQMFAAFGAGTNASDPIVTAKTTFTNGLSGVWSGLLWLFVTPFYWICGVWYRRMRCLTLGDWFHERYQSKSIALAYMIFGAVFYMAYLGVGMTAIGKMGAPLVGAEYLTLFGIKIPFDHAIIILTALCVLFYGVLGGLRAAYWTDLIQGVFIIILSIILIPIGLNALSKDDSYNGQSTVAIQEVNSVNSVDSDFAEQSQNDVDEFNNAGKQIVDEETVPAKQDVGANASLKDNVLNGFTVLHKRVPSEFFEILTSPKGGEFPLHYILAITLLNLIGIVCQPHFIATGGGSAKTEFNARFGLVAGNILKRFCTIGWALTALVALAYLASNAELAADPDKVWGVATRELLAPMNAGLVGLMLACLLAALMSSASCYMLVVSGLVVRNGYAAYINPNASERVCVLAGRICGAIVIIGATISSLLSMNVFEQLKFAWEIPIVFAAPFWIGMYWRRANKWSAWATILITLSVFFIIPQNIAKFKPEFTGDVKYLATNLFIDVQETRLASLTDVERNSAIRANWEKNADAIKADLDPNLTEEEIALNIQRRLGKEPNPIELGDQIVTDFKTGGKAVYWSGGITPFDQDGNELVFEPANGMVVAKIVDGAKWYLDQDEQFCLFDESKTKREELSESRVRIEQSLKSPEQLNDLGVYFVGKGAFELDFLLYDKLGVNLQSVSNGTLEALRLPTRLFLPFLILILLSFITPRGDKEALDRYYVKMKTPVDPNPEKDKEELQKSYDNPARFDDQRLFKFGGLEFSKPNKVDVFGFLISFAICIGVVWLIVAVANYQP
ncbi:MAG: hypothetical protein Q4G03_08685 [Planctomycetia bacterium]|nr:hypothetical protein [Planctomycetia bacterium]